MELAPLRRVGTRSQANRPRRAQAGPVAVMAEAVTAAAREAVVRVAAVQAAVKAAVD